MTETTSKEFRANFIASGGFEAVLKLFIESGSGKHTQSLDTATWRRNRMGNECALRIIKECFFIQDDDGNDEVS